MFKLYSIIVYLMLLTDLAVQFLLFSYEAVLDMFILLNPIQPA
jgi:hypothetical protein